MYSVAAVIGYDACFYGLLMKFIDEKKKIHKKYRQFDIFMVCTESRTCSEIIWRKSHLHVSCLRRPTVASNVTNVN